MRSGKDESVPEADVVVLAGRYELGELLGRGGAADVHRAHDRVLDRPVAVKLLRQAGEEGDRARFTAEGRLLARLHHPHLVAVLDAGSHEDRPYLVMQLVEGSTLSQELGDGPLQPDRVRAVGAGIADALAHVHDAGMVHRDVKPGNVLLDAAGVPRLSDFGIARLLADTTRHTSTGITLGTAAYLAPEQVRGEEVSGATDVYALGLVLLEALTGTREYAGPPTEVALARLHRSPAVPDDLPEPWPQLLRAMTAMDPQQRPSAAQVAGVLGSGNGTAGGHGAGVAATSGATLDRTEAVPTVPVGPAADATEAAVPPPGRPPQAHGEAGGPAGTRPATGRTRRGRAGEPGRTGAAVLLTVVALLAAAGVLAYLVGVLPGGSGGDGSTVPDGVPAELEEPLQRLHDAVEGG